MFECIGATFESSFDGDEAVCGGVTISFCKCFSACVSWLLHEDSMSISEVLRMCIQ